MKKVLVLCTGNSCRSQIAEGYLKHFAGDKATIYSAGVETHGVNPKAIETMKADGIDISQHTSNNILEYQGVNFDFVITVCDNAANEVCPAWIGQPITAHWGVFDPAAVAEEEKNIAFAKAFAVLHRRISLFTSLNPAGLEQLALEKSVRDIGTVN